MQRSELLYLSREQVEALGIAPAEVIGAVEIAFREKGEGRVEMPPKPGLHPGGDAFLHAMPAHVPALEAAGIKWVSGFPDNRKRGLPYISGLLILSDPRTGLPLSVMDATWITAVRTAAVTAVAARLLARPDAATLGVLGCGVQGRSNLLALGEVLPLRRVRAYDVHAERAAAYAGEMAAASGLEVAAVAEPAAAVRGSDVVVTAGPILLEPHGTIRAGWLAAGAFACALDFDSYWHPEALAEADKFTTDDTAQLDYYRGQGYFRSIPPVWADLGELVAGRKPGREADGERILCCPLGLAIADVATARLIYDRARRDGTGTRLPL